MSSADERLERIERKLDQLLAATVGRQSSPAVPIPNVRDERTPNADGGHRHMASMPDVIICADWSKHPRNRRAWVADPVQRRIMPLGAAAPTVELLVQVAERYRADGYALIAVDAPIGVPASYFDSARPFFDIAEKERFIDWLPVALGHEDFFDPVTTADDWSPSRPFFRVPKGVGGLTSMLDAARTYGAQLFREIDIATGAKSVFALDIPGQVAPAAQALWQELMYALDQPHVAVWPFDGGLEDIGQSKQVVVAEIYPRAAYGTALAAELPAKPRTLAKTKADVRHHEVGNLLTSMWVRDKQVVIEEAELALHSEDEFDALMTAAALLRLTLTELPLSTFVVDPVAEGAILAV